MLFATREDFRVALPLGVRVDQEQYLSLLLETASDVIESACRRKFKKQAYTEYFDGLTGERTTARLQAIPIDLAQPFQLWDDSTLVFGSASLLTINTDYTVNTVSGMVECIVQQTQFPLRVRRAAFLPGVKSVKVTYTGGYAEATVNGQTVIAVPARVKLATLALARAWLLNQDSVGRGGSPARQGTTVDHTATIPPQVLGMLGPERRILYA